LDNLTHALVGAAISKAGAERTTPLATATLVVAANAPDIDVLSYVKGEYFALSFRRGITHGWLALMVLPVLVAGFMLAWDRWVRRRHDPNAEPARAGAILGLSALGLLTHPTLDWMNTYGVRWALPFGGTWSYGDALFIIDPWIWLTLGGAVFLSSRPDGRGSIGWGVLAVLTSALIIVGVGSITAVVWTLGLLAIVGFRIRQGARGPMSQRAVGSTIACVVAYVFVLVGGDAVARRQVRQAAEAVGLTVEDVMVAPRPGNPFRADIEVLTRQGYVPGTHRWIGSPRVDLDPAVTVPLLTAPDRLSSARTQAILEVARARPSVRDYLVWSRYPYVRVTSEGDGWRVRFSDARYDGRPSVGGLSGVSVHIADSEIS